MTPTDTLRNDLQIRCSIGDTGTITIDASSLPRDTVQQILELLLQLPPSLRSVAPDPAPDRAPLVDWCRRCGVVDGTPHTSPCTDPEHHEPHTTCQQCAPDATVCSVCSCNAPNPGTICSRCLHYGSLHTTP